MAEFNTSEGEIGVYAGHIPMTVILKPGVLTITEAEGKKKSALHTGFAEILPEEITILAKLRNGRTRSIWPAPRRRGNGRRKGFGNIGRIRIWPGPRPPCSAPWRGSGRSGEKVFRRS